MEKLTPEVKFCRLDNLTAVHDEKGYFETLKEAKQNQRHPWESMDYLDILLDDSDYSPMFMTF